MVFPDHDPTHPEKGGRFIFGKITDVFKDIITVEITGCPKCKNCTCHTWQWKKHDQIFFHRHMIWTYKENASGVQLSLF